MDIITLTPNPARDLYLLLDPTCPSDINRARTLASHSGGKGINLSRALTVNSVDNLAVVFVGKEGAEEFLLPIYNIGVRVEPIYTEGKTRENINIQEGEGERVISTDGPAVTRENIEELRRLLDGSVGKDTVLVLSGSIPKGSDKAALLALLHGYRALGARIAVDSRSLTAAELLSLSPYVIKPNENEAEALFGRRPTSLADAAKIAETIRGMGCENVLLTMGEMGAVLAAEDGVYFAKAPKIIPVSTVGAGDSTLAGFLAARSLGKSSPDALAIAMSWGSAACMEEGSMPPRPEKIADLFGRISVREYKRNVN